MAVRILVFLSAAALLVGAGARATTARGTLVGTVTRGPIVPVCVAEQPCDEPARGVTLVFWRSGVAVARALTNAAGHYQVRLPAGIYVVRRAHVAAVDRKLAPSRVRVYAARRIHVDFSIDTGIR